MSDEDTYREGSPRRLTHSLPGDPRRERSGWHLGDVVRDILWELVREHEWGQVDVGDRLGCAQNTAGRKLHGKTEITLDELSRLCIALDMDPLQLFRSHPVYRGKEDGKVTFPKDHLYRRYNAVLRTAEARGLLDRLEQAQALGVFGEAIEEVDRLVAAAEKAHRAARTRGRQRRKGPDRRGKSKSGG